MDEQAQAGAVRAVPVGSTIRWWLRRIVVVAGLGAVAWLLAGTTASYADTGPRADVPAVARASHAEAGARVDRSGSLPSLPSLSPPPRVPSASRHGAMPCPPRPIIAPSDDRGWYVCPLSPTGATAIDVVSLAEAPTRPVVRTLSAPSRALDRLDRLATVTAPADDSLDLPLDHPTVLTGLLTGARSDSPSSAAAGGITRHTDSGERPSAVPLSGRPSTDAPAPVRSVRPLWTTGDAATVGGTARSSADQPVPVTSPPTSPSGPGPALPTLPGVPASSGAAGSTSAGTATAAVPADRPTAPGLRRCHGPARYLAGPNRRPADDPSVSPD